MNRIHLAKLIVAAGLGMGALAGAVHGQEPTAAELPDGPGKAQVMTACTACHAITQVTSQVHTKPQWAELVDQMIARGAAVSDEDYPVIVEYLGKNLAPAASTAPAKTPRLRTAQPFRQQKTERRRARRAVARSVVSPPQPAGVTVSLNS